MILARVAPKTLCSACVFSHIVRGYAPQEENIFAGARMRCARSCFAGRSRPTFAPGE